MAKAGSELFLSRTTCKSRVAGEGHISPKTEKGNAVIYAPTRLFYERDFMKETI